MLLVILIVLLFLALGGGFWGRGRYGNISWSPVLIILAVGLVLMLSGHLRIG